MQELTHYAAWVGAIIAVSNFSFSIFQYVRSEHKYKIAEQKLFEKETALVGISVVMSRSVNEPVVKRYLQVHVLNKSIYPINIDSVVLGKIPKDYHRDDNLAGELLRFEGYALNYPARIDAHHVAKFDASGELLTPKSTYITVKDIN